MAFNWVARLPPGEVINDTCYSHQLAYATPDNIRYLKGFLDRLSGSGDTDYKVAINKAMDLLRNSISGEDIRARRQSTYRNRENKLKYYSTVSLLHDLGPGKVTHGLRRINIPSIFY